MESTIGELQVKITAITKDFSSKISGAVGELDKMGAQARKAGDSVGQTFQKMDKAASVAIMAVGATAAAGVGMAVKAFANYEQLVGGVETMFKESSGQLMQYANMAYKTAGLSANDYMETVTNFSASLLQGLGGDTKKAVEYANMAVTDMSDNANKFGTDIKSIQWAYQGFAKDNFTMLDNLKLGYGGTASEMARLVNDSGVLGDSFEATAENVKDIPFDQLIQAINKTQQEMGITGTTAKEASSTISGSWNSVKGAFENVLTGVEGSSDQLADSVLNLWGQLAEKVPQIVGKMADGMFSAMKKVVDEKFGAGSFDVMASLAAGLATLAVAIKVVTVAQAAWNAVQKASMLSKVIVIVTALAGAVTYFFTQTELGRDIFNKVFTAIKDTATTVWNSITQTWGAVSEFFSEAFSGAQQIVTDVFSGIKETVDSVLGGIKQWIDDNATAIMNWSIVIGTILLPKIVALGIQAAITFAQMALQAATTAAGMAISGITAFAAWITGAITALANGITTFATLAVQAVIASGKMVATGAVAFASWIAGFIATAAQAVASFVVIGVQALIAGGKMVAAWMMALGPIGLVVAAVVGAAALIMANFDRVKEWGRAAWAGIQGAWSGAVGWFGGVVNGIAGFFSSIPGKVRGFFTDAWNNVKSINWLQLGADIISGIVKGLNPGKIIEKMKSIASSALDTVKSFLGIKSPSRVMRDEVGKMMGEGMAIGIDQSTKDAVKAASNSAGSVFGAYAGVFNTNLPNLGLDTTVGHTISGLDARPMHITVMVGEDKLVDKVINGINNSSFMSNGTTIRV